MDNNNTILGEAPIGKLMRGYAIPRIISLLVELCPRQLIAIFGAANESSYYTAFAVKAFRVYLCMMVLACVNKACFIFLQALGKALASTMLSMFREVVFGVGFALALPLFFGLDGVLYSMPVSDVPTFLISAIIIVKTYRELNEQGVQKQRNKASLPSVGNSAAAGVPLEGWWPKNWELKNARS